MVTGLVFQKGTVPTVTYATFLLGEAHALYPASLRHSILPHTGPTSLNLIIILVSVTIAFEAIVLALGGER